MTIGTERLSLDRPGWTSESKTGMFHAYKHLHTIRGVAENHFVKTRGFRTMQDLADAKRENRR